MAELDSKPACALAPVSPTYMPFFRPHRSPLSSSSNTRQREDYEQGSQLPPLVVAPQVLVTSTDADDDEQSVVVAEQLVASYPAWEFPFASEPALEGELEQGLPPLKKLKSGTESADGGLYLEQGVAGGLVVIGAVKGILTRRESASGSAGQCTSTSQGSSPSGAHVQPCFTSWSDTLSVPFALGNTGLSAYGSNSRSLSRRSSSNASSACTTSLKAVRFASGNGFMSCWAGRDIENATAGGTEEFEGPVAAVMYLTHSADAYDRSPIVVESGLRLPPRAKKEDEEGGGWVKCGEVEKLRSGSAMSSGKNRLAKLDVEATKATSNQACSSPTASSPTETHEDGECPSSRESEAEEVSLAIKKPGTPCRMYREVEPEEDDEDDASTAGATGEEDQEAGEDDQEDGKLEIRRIGSDEGIESEDEEEGERRGRQWGFGNWSNGEVFECSDALGGF